MTTADKKVNAEDRKTPATPFAIGAGEIDPGRVDRRGSSFDPGLAGSQTVTRSVTSVADRTVTYRATAKDLAGYDVTVTPSTFTIAPGETVTFGVTIVNTSAPAGKWRFGQLELKGNGYTVTSPIAVNRALFDAPSDVAGSGADGSVDVDVLFGYTGSYSAAAHGLVPSTVVSGSIGHDPDQTYPNGDDAPGPGGGVDTFPIVVADSAFLGIALTIPGPDDTYTSSCTVGGSRHHRSPIRSTRGRCR